MPPARLSPARRAPPRASAAARVCAPLICAPLICAALICAALVLLAACSAPAAPPPPPAPPTTTAATLAPSEAPTQAPADTPVPTRTPGPDLAQWKLLWSDEFDAPDGSAVDRSRWVAQVGEAPANAELEYYTDRVENAYVENADGRHGVLVIKAIKEPYHGLSYTSARLKTVGKFEQTYGRFEARIQIPYGQGIWPAFWMLGTQGGWPLCGEVDVMENIGKEPGLVHGTLHGPGYSGTDGISASYALPGGQAFADGFHLYAVEWEPGAIRWYVDDTLYQTVTPARLPKDAAWVFDRPFYLLLNVAVGGGWPGYPDATSVFPQMMKVDYVRVYERP